MTKQVQRRRGTATQHTSFTGAEGELSVNTTNKSVHVHDGATAGGIELARKDGSNVAFTSGTLDGVTIGGTTAGAGTFTNLTATGTTTLAGASTSADITFGDNDKAIFGAGSDLQIYHDGSGSRIYENGTGVLAFYSNGSGINFYKGEAAENMLTLSTDGAVTAYYDGSQKLATTATGVDISGTLTSDGLTVDGNILLETSGNPTITNKTTGAGNNPAYRLQADTNYWDMLGVFSDADDTLRFRYNDTDALKIANNGDISFYEDTGTTAKFFWDASDQRLDLQAVGVDAADSTVLRLSQNNFNSGGTTLIKIGTENTTWSKGAIGFERTGDYDKGSLIFCTNNTTSNADVTSADERMRITSGGTLQIAGGGNDNVGEINMGNTAQNANRFQVRHQSSAWILKTVDSEPLLFGTANSERMRIDSSGNVAIGHTSANSARLHLKGSGSAGVPQFMITDNSSGKQSEIRQDTSGNLVFDHWTGANRSERMRIDSSGNVLVGKTSGPNYNAVGIDLTYLGEGQFTTDGLAVLQINRQTSDGDIAVFRKDGTAVGSIGSVAGDMYIVTGDTGLRFVDVNDSISPTDANGAARDNAVDLGNTGTRFDDIYATNGTIQTSDQNEKQQIASLTDAEITAAKAISKLFKTFKWNDSVAEKGDAARTHTGVIAQEVEQAMTDAGLDAGDYAFFISSDWTDEETGEERNRKGIRYPQLLSFIGAATEQRLASIEARLDALEGA